VQATPAHVQSTLSQVKQIRVGGSTNLFAGIEMAYQGLDEDRSSGVVVVTDGVANVGQTQHAQFLQLLKRFDVRLFTFVIGNSANQPLMDRLAHDSGGFAMNISDSDDIIGRLLQAKNKILYENMHDVQLSFSGEQVTDVTPAQHPNLYRGQQLIAFGRYTHSDRVTVELSARISGREETWQCVADLPEVDTDNPELERLWALSRIDEVMETIRESGESDRWKQQVIDLGTQYSLVTDYTSMVVLEEAEMENSGIQPRNAQRVQRERQAQQARRQQPVRSYDVGTSSTDQDNASAKDQGMFRNRHAPGFGGGTGPVGPLFIALLVWARRKTRNGLRP
jgi:Ca-activated chloride channel family protein